MRLGVLTGGGDCPGLNPALRAVVMRAMDFGDECVGIKLGWGGLINGDTVPLTIDVVDDIISRGGTILESSRTNPFKREQDLQATLDHIQELKLDVIIALGGEDTLGVAHKLFKLGVHTVGVPKTMDNDLNRTDYTFGFDSAVQVATDAADRLRDTARSHRRVMVLEVMGRHAGWVALETGVAGGADWILIPEEPLDLDEMCGHLGKLRERGKHHGLVVVSEGVEVTEADHTAAHTDDFGHVVLRERGVGEFVAKEIEERAGFETRLAVLGHIVRGGAPTAFDRMLATRLGIRAVDLAHEGKFGYMASLTNNQYVGVPLEQAVAELKTVPHELYQEIKTLFK
ncbi:MAG TPA: ATP-dependent 6-phosphofructokinase [Armatimonadota bacterium]|nr:ATP-dependent 6-phosphofructokinase [Armatimonadota bacterium]